MVNMKDKARILLVDDEPRLIHLVRAVLGAKGYEVLAAVSGEHAIEMTALEQPDLILLDIVLTGTIDGYNVAQRIREFSDVPIIMLTAKVRESDKLRGFDVGADDYITKPFSSKELLARIQAVLKRSHGDMAKLAKSEIICGDVRIDLARRQVMIDEREIYLTPTEYNLLHELAVHPNQILLHEHLLTKVWGAEYRDDLKYLRSYIHYLRKKLEVDPANPKIIISSLGVGYMLVTPDGERQIDSQKVTENDT
jgi:two-component system KDP operon response regulator KdpE